MSTFFWFTIDAAKLFIAYGFMAEWETQLRANEREEMERARIARDASASVYRELVKKLKARCIKRLRRSEGSKNDE